MTFSTNQLSRFSHIESVAQIIVFSECVVRNNAPNSYPIINNQCPNAFTSTKQSTQSDASIIQVSFTSFEFMDTSSDFPMMTIQCSVSCVKNIFGY